MLTHAAQMGTDVRACWVCGRVKLAYRLVTFAPRLLKLS